MGRKLDRRRRKKALQRGEMIPGVPALLHGGVAHAGANPFLDAAALNTARGQTPIQGAGGPPSGDAGLRAAGWIEIRPGIWFNPLDGDTIDLRESTLTPPRSGGGGAAAPQFRPGELDLLREQFAFEQESFQLDLELRRLQEQHANAIAQGNLDLARQTEARIDRIQTQQLELDRRRLQLDASLGRAQGISGLATSRGQIEAQRAQ